MNSGSPMPSRSVTRRALLRAIGWIAGTASFLGLGALQTGTASASGQDDQLTGSWAVTLNRNYPTFLVTFIADGTMVGSNIARASAFHGTWTRTGDREFAYTQLQFRFDPGGTLMGTEKIRGHLTLDETLNGYTAQTVTEVRDLEGNLVQTNRFTPRGQRIMVEPLV